jgi:chromosome segregation ATPase
MITRTGQVLLRQKYEADTESIRSEYERVKNGLVDAIQKTAETQALNTSLIGENRKLIESSNFLKNEIADQQAIIETNKIIINQIESDCSRISDKKESLKSEITKIESNRYEKLQEEVSAQETLQNTQSKVSQALSFLDRVNEKIAQAKLDLESITKDCAVRLANVEEKEKALSEFEKQLNQKALDNQGERSLLDLYKERLNKRYEELGLNIKL